MTSSDCSQTCKQMDMDLLGIRDMVNTSGESFPLSASH